MPKQPPNQPDPIDQAVPEDVLTLILRYHDNDLDDAGLSKLREALTQSQPARALFVRWALHSQVLSESLSANYQEEAEDPWQGSTNFLSELAKLEQQAQASLVEIHHFDKPWYLTRWAAGLGSIAAILAIAITLILNLTANDSPPTHPDFTTNTPSQNKPTESAKPIPRDHPTTTPVATLTNTHNATWGRPASAGTDAAPEHPPTTGSPLHPNTRLTLTAGFAEITTSRGAVVILEAPATIEMIDHNNALRLHTGKLVGICETQSSKGFLVRTPHMDVTDLGTRFGVEANDVVTEVHVLKGEVQATRPDAAPAAEPMLLTANQSARTSADTDLITRIEYDDQPFAALGPRTIDLVGTGVGLAVHQADPAWVVVSENGKPLKTPVPMQVSDAFGHIRNLPNDPQRSQWLAWTPENPPDQEQSTYRIRTTILVPSDVDHSTAKLAIQFAADNQLIGVLVNGSRVEMPPEKPERGWHALKPLAITQYLTAGTNRIEFEIVNFSIGEGRVNGEELGLRIAWQLHASPLLFADESPHD